MSNRQIDERVVEMKFNNENFEKNASQTMKTLKALDTALNAQSAKNINDISDAVKKVNFKHIEDGLDSLNKKFSTVGTFSRRMVENIADSTYGLMKSLKAMTVDKAFSFAWRNIITGGEARASKIEQARFSLGGIFKGSDAEVAARVAAVMDDVDESVTGTAYGYDQAAQAAAMLVTSGRAATKENGQLLQDLKAIAGLTAQTNGNYQEFADIFTKVATAGKVTNDRMQQLNTRGISAYETMATFFNKVKNGEETTVKLTKEASDEILNLSKNISKVTASDIQQMISDSKKNGGISFDVFSAAMNDAFAENAFKANTTLNGVMDNLAAQFKQIGQKFYAPIIAQNSELVQLIDAVRLKIKDFKSEVFFDSTSDNMNIADEFAYTVLAVAQATKEWVQSIDIRKVAEVAINVIQGLTNVFHALGRIIEAVGAGIKQTLGLFNIDNVIELAEGFNDITDALILSDGAMENFTRGAAGISRLIKEILNIGLRFIKGISPVQGDIVEILNGAIDGLSNVLGYLGDIADAVADEIANFGELDTMFNAIGKAARSVLGAVLRLLGSFRESDEYLDNIKNLKDFFSGIVSVVTLLAKTVSVFFTSLFRSENDVENKNKSLLGTLLEILGLIGRVTKSVADWLTQTNVAQTVAGLLSKVLTFIFNTLGKIYNLIKTIAGSAAIPAITAAIEFIKNSVLMIADFAQNSIGGIFEKISGIGSAIAGAFGKDTEDRINGVANALDGTAISLEKIEDTEPDNLLEKFVKRIKNFFEDLRAGRSIKIFDNLGENIQKFKDTLKDFYKDIKEGSTGIGIIDNLSNMITKIKERIAEGGFFTDLVETLKDFGKTILDVGKSIKDSLSDYSEGTNVITRFIESFKNIKFRGSLLVNFEVIKEKFKNIRDALKKFVGDIYTNILPYLQKINFKAIFATIIGVFAIKKILDFVGKLASVPFSITKSITGVVDAIKKTITVINEQLPKLFKALVKVINSASLAITAAAFIQFAIGIGILAGAVALLAYTFKKGGIKAFGAAIGGLVLLGAVLLGLSIVGKIISRAFGTGGFSINKFSLSAAGIIGILISLTAVVATVGMFLMVPFSNDWEKRFDSLAKLFLGLAVIIGIAAIVASKMSNGLFAFGTLTGLAILLASLTLAFTSVLKMDIPKSNDMSMRAGILVTMIFAMLGIAWALMEFSKTAKNVNALSMPIWNIIGVCILLKTMVSAFKSLMEVELGNLWGIRLLALGGIIFGIYKIVEIMMLNTPNGASVFSAGGTLIGIAALLLSITLSLNILFNTKFLSDEIGLGGAIGRLALLTLILVAMAGLIYEIAYVTPSGTTALKAGGTILAFAVFLLVLVPSLVILSRFSFLNILKAVVELGLVFVALGFTIGEMNKISKGNSIKGGYQQILAMAGALLAITVALSLLSMLDPVQTIQDAISLGLVLVAIGGALALANRFKKYDLKNTTIKQLIIMVVALIAIAGSMYLLKDLNPGQLLSMAGALAGVLLAISKAISIASGMGKMSNIKDIWPVVVAIGTISILALILSQFSQGIDAKQVLAFGGILTALSVVVGILAAIYGSLSELPLANNTQIFDGVLLTFIKVIGIIAAIAVVTMLLIKFLGWLNENGEIDKGVDAAVYIAKGLSRMAAALITGFIEEFGESFEKVGNNIKAFAENTQNFFDTINNIDTGKAEGFKDIIKSVLSIGEGSNFINFADRIEKYADSFKDLGNALTNFANYLNIGDKGESITAIVPLLQTLTDAQFNFEWIEDNKETIENTLPNLADAISRLAKRARNIDKNAEENIKRIKDILMIFTEIKSDVYIGDISDMTNVADLVERLRSVGSELVSFSTDIKGLQANSVEKAGYARDILIAMGEASGQISEDKGLLGLLFDCSTDEIGKLSDNLQRVAKGIYVFSELTKDLNPDVVDKAGIVGTVLTDLSVSLNNKKHGLANDKAVEKFTKNLSGFGTAFNEFYSNLALTEVEKFEQFVTAMTLITEATNLNYESMKLLPEKMGELAQSGVDEYIQAFIENVDYIKAAMNNFIETVYWSLSGITKGSDNRYKSAGLIALNAFADGLISDYKYLNLRIGNLITHISGQFRTPENVKILKGIGNGVNTSIANGLNGVNDVIDATSELSSTLVITFKDALEIGNDGISTVFTTIGKYIPASLAAGIGDKEALEILGKAAYEMASLIEGTTRDTTHVYSPSDIFKEIGWFIPESIAEGIDSNEDKITEAAESMGTSLISTIAAIVNELQTNPDLDIAQAIDNVMSGGAAKVNDYFNLSGMAQSFIDKNIDISDANIASLFEDIEKELGLDGLIENSNLDQQLADVKKEYIEAIKEAKKKFAKNEESIGNSIADLRKSDYSNSQYQKELSKISQEYAKKIKEIEDKKRPLSIEDRAKNIFNSKQGSGDSSVLDNFLSSLTDSTDSLIDEETKEELEKATKKSKTWSTVPYKTSKGTSMGAYQQVIDEIKVLEEQVQAIQQKVGAYSVTLDSGALVGQLGPKIDAYMGNAAILQGRQ